NGNLIGLVSSYTSTDGSNHQVADVWFTKDVQPQTSAETAKVSLHDVLAPPSEALLGGTPAELAKAGMPAGGPDAHLAAIDRKLAEDDEQRRNNGSNWL
ncbi:MAG: hypothetical protein JNL93_00235, partial [Pelomonas sp.]|nr:hypothetical protein [Roseateles sp.]